MSDVKINDYPLTNKSKCGQSFDVKINVSTLGNITNLKMCFELVDPRCKFIGDNEEETSRICESRALFGDIKKQDLTYSLKITCPAGDVYLAEKMIIIASDGGDEQINHSKEAFVEISC